MKPLYLLPLFTLTLPPSPSPLLFFFTSLLPRRDSDLGQPFYPFWQPLLTFSFCLYCAVFLSPPPSRVRSAPKAHTFIPMTHTKLSCHLVWLQLLEKLLCCECLLFFPLLCVGLENMPGKMAGVPLISSLV